MRNKIIYGAREFDDGTITNGVAMQSNSMMFDSLSADALEIEVISRELGNRRVLTNAMEWYTTVNGAGYVIAAGDIRKFTYGDPIEYHYDGELWGRYYVQNVTRIGRYKFKITATSAIGLLMNNKHYGGIYDGVAAGDLITEIFGSIPVVIDEDVAAVSLYGYLPIESSRDALAQVLFAIGGSVVKTANGTPRIRFLQGVPAITIPQDRIYMGGSVDYTAPATKVQVIEHSYYKSAYDKAVSLYDNTMGTGTADHELVAFNNPCYDLEAVGLTIHESGANYAIVSGTGALIGMEYTHTTKQFETTTGRTGEERIASISSATLVSLVNSANVAARVSDYQGQAEVVKVGIVLSTDGMRTGSVIKFTDPFGDESEGFVSDMAVTMSGTLKSDTTVVKNYIPSHFGNNYANVQIITADTTWTPPAGVERVRFVIGQGGQAGQNGEQGKNAYKYGGTFADDNVAAGDGGQGGQAGNAGKINVVDVASLAASYAITIGAGGTPNEGSLDVGNEGGHSTVTGGGITYTSADGAIPPEGYREIIGGNTYATIGRDGIAGATGGPTGVLGVGKAGQSLTYNGQTWAGGAGSTVVINTTNHKSGGGSGGGAAYNGAGGDGNPASYNSLGNATGGQGGNGGNAGQIPYTPSLSGGGQGGCGGGGGGCPSLHRNRSSSSQDLSANWGTVGYGGAFSLGGVGGSGFVAIYY